MTNDTQETLKANEEPTIEQQVQWVIDSLEAMIQEKVKSVPTGEEITSVIIPVPVGHLTDIKFYFEELLKKNKEMYTQWELPVTGNVLKNTQQSSVEFVTTSKGELSFKIKAYNDNLEAARIEAQKELLATEDWKQKNWTNIEVALNEMKVKIEALTLQQLKGEGKTNGKKKGDGLGKIGTSSETDAIELVSKSSENKGLDN